MSSSFGVAEQRGSAQVSVAVSCFVFGVAVGSLCRAALWCSVQVVVLRRAVSLCCFYAEGAFRVSGGNEHVWLFTRRVLLPLVSSSALESTPFLMLLVALQGV